MIYEEIVKKAVQAAKKVNKDAIEEHLAVEFDIEGEGEGAFYVELDKGKIDVQPYEYYDCDCRIRGGADVIMVPRPTAASIPCLPTRPRIVAWMWASRPASMSTSRSRTSPSARIRRSTSSLAGINPVRHFM